MKTSPSTYKIHVKGLVQGVGFRPFVYRLAKKYGLTGEVANNNNGVIIKISINGGSIAPFIEELKYGSPRAALVKEIEITNIAYRAYQDFFITQSQNTGSSITGISPDIAVCSNCLEDMEKQPHRVDYPFINCTNCGPRFSIIKKLPYDRQNTTMRSFIMCGQCHEEYNQVLDRRFHAQPVACNHCGPQYALVQQDEKLTLLKDILNKIEQLLKTSKIIAIKGIGGFHLMCDAFNDQAISRLRDRKRRYTKPFAVMFPNVEVLKKYVVLTEKDLLELTSWRRPILLAKEKKKLSDSINPGLNQLGVMLPYMPLHYLIFKSLSVQGLIMTSANIGGEPVIKDDKTALLKLKGITDAFLLHNREIHNRVDDAVIRTFNNKIHLIRRARGYVPKPIEMNFDVDGIFAAGADLKNCFCIGKEKQAIMSQHNGDLENYEAFAFYKENVKRFLQLFRVNCRFIACDMHTGYFSTRSAENWNDEFPEIQKRYKLLKVQHHHAHCASVLAEHNISEKVIGISLDGTGFGDDGNSWGGEFLFCDLNEYERFTHFKYMPMPGGEKAIQEPWRMAVSYLYDAFGDELNNLDLPFLKDIPSSQIQNVVKMISRDINSPLTSSAGRLFDTVSALLNVCKTSGYEAEAPMKLEALVKEDHGQVYRFDINKTVDFKPTIMDIVHDIQKSKPIENIATTFHNTVAAAIAEVSIKMQKKSGINKIVLSGGSFQNVYLLNKTIESLEKAGFVVLINKEVPCNDGGIALGQLAIAAKKLQK